MSRKQYALQIAYMSEDDGRSKRRSKELCGCCLHSSASLRRRALPQRYACETRPYLQGARLTATSGRGSVPPPAALALALTRGFAAGGPFATLDHLGLHPVPFWCSRRCIAVVRIPTLPASARRDALSQFRGIRDRGGQVAWYSDRGFHGRLPNGSQGASSVPSQLQPATSRFIRWSFSGVPWRIPGLVTEPASLSRSHHVD